MHIFKLTSRPREQIDDLDGFAWKLGGFFASSAQPMRMIVTSRPFAMDGPIQALNHEQQRLRRLARLADPLLRAIDQWLVDGSTDPGAALRDLEAEGRTRLLNIFVSAPLLYGWLQRAIAAESVVDDHALDGALRTDGDALDVVVPTDGDALDVAVPTDGDALVLAAPTNGHVDHATLATPFAANAAELWVAVADTLSRLLWSLPWRTDLVHFYERLSERHLRGVDHYLLSSESETVQRASLQTQLAHTFGGEAEALDALPPVIRCPYTIHDAALEPTEPGHPWLAVLHSYEMRGEWTALTLHELLDVGFDVSVVVDVETVGRNRTRRMMELAYNAARISARDERLLDTRAEQVYVDSQRVLHESTQQSFHLVTVAVLVSGATRLELEHHVAIIRDRLGSTLRLMRVAGAQDQLLRLWSSAPTRQLDLPRKPWNVLSHGVGCCAGLIGFHGASRTDGILWGIDAIRRAPLFHDPFRNNQAGHMCILGKTGYGKTWFLNMVTMRAALQGWKVIALDIAGNGLRIERAAGMGCRCNLIGLENAINILDIVFPADAEGGWLRNQVQHVIDQLAMLLGESAASAHGQVEMQPRRFSIAERGLLDQALSTLYAGVDPAAPLTDMPILSDLMVVLDALHEAETTALSRDLRLYLAGSLGATFNAPTAIDWDFASDINYFDFSETRVPRPLQAFFYGQCVGAINRYMHDPHRDRRRPTLLLIDEYHMVARTESVARMAAELAKFARKHRIAVMPVDQNPHTFLAEKWTRSIWENTTAKAIFHLDDLPAQEIGAAIGDLTPEHIQFISHAAPGEAVLVLGENVYVAHIETNPRETRAFAGS